MPILYTIGFTKKSAEEFFGILQASSVGLIADIRLNPFGHLAGFTKQRDLKYFLRFFDIEYEHWETFAPTEELRRTYRSDKNWEKYKKGYQLLIDKRRAFETLDPRLFEQKRVCLLCSETIPERCHRSLVAEMIQKGCSKIQVVHL